MGRAAKKQAGKVKFMLFVSLAVILVATVGVLAMQEAELTQQTVTKTISHPALK